MLILAAATVPGSAQDNQAPGLRNATILIIRHAEKPEDGSGLSAMGEQRAQAYVNYFRNKFLVDSKPLHLDELRAAADSEASHRPRLTLEPLSKAVGLSVNVRFKDKEFQKLADDIKSGQPSRNILICWHHGEIPRLAQALGAEPGSLLPGGKWPGEIFGWVLQLRYDANGRLIPGETKRIEERLLPGDSAP
jgi:hypothetical protein